MTRYLAHFLDFRTLPSFDKIVPNRLSYRQVIEFFFSLALSFISQNGIFPKTELDDTSFNLIAQEIVDALVAGQQLHFIKNFL